MRWPWPRVAFGLAIDFLHRGGAKVVAVDVQLHRARSGAHLRLRRSQGHLERPPERPRLRGLGPRVRQRRHAGRCRVRGHRGRRRQGRARRPNGRRRGSTSPRSPSRVRWSLAPFQELADAAAALGHNFLTRDDDGPARRMPPFIVSDGKELPSLGVAAALLAGGFKPEDVSAEGHELRIGDRRVPLVSRRVNGRDQWSMLINYRAPALDQERRRPARTAVSVVRIPPDLRGRAGSPERREAADRSGRLQGQDRVRRPHRVGAAGRLRHAALDVGVGIDARDSAAREHGRQHPREPLHHAGVHAIAARLRRHHGGLDRPARGLSAVHGRGGRVAGADRRLDVARGERVQERTLAEPRPAGLGRRRWPCSSARPTSTSSRGGRSGRSRNSSAVTSRATCTHSS